MKGFALKLAGVFLLAALVVLGLSMRMEPFVLTGGADWFSSVSDGDSTAYYRARSNALTPKYELQDYGITLFSLAGVTALLSRKGGIQAPASRAGFVALALTAPLATVAGFVFDLFLAFGRREFPPWADSPGIPLAGVPIMFFVLATWSWGHFTCLAGIKKKTQVRLSLVTLRGGHAWLLFVACVTALLVVLMAFAGAYWYAVPGTLWLYYYLSIAAVHRSQEMGRRATRREHPQAWSRLPRV